MAGYATLTRGHATQHPLPFRERLLAEATEHAREANGALAAAMRYQHAGRHVEARAMRMVGWHHHERIASLAATNRRLTRRAVVAWLAGDDIEVAS